MKKNNYLLKEVDFDELYYLYLNTLVGKLTKKGKKFKALNIYNNIKEKIKLQTNKERNISFIFILSMLNSMPKVSFKEIRLGSQKKDIPMPISQKKQVLVSVETLLNISRKKKKLEVDKLIECIISSCNNKGIIIRNKKIIYRKAIVNKMLLSIFIPKKPK